MRKKEKEIIDSFWENPELIKHDFFDLNLIKIFANKIKNKNIERDKKVYHAIVISSGCRSSEPLHYKIIEAKKDIVLIKIPILKRKKESWKKVNIRPSTFNLTTEDFIKQENKFGSRLKYYRSFVKYFKIDPRSYRRYFITWLAHKGIRVSDIRDIVGHSTIAVTDKYIRRLDYNYQLLLKL